MKNKDKKGFLIINSTIIKLALVITMIISVIFAIITNLSLVRSVKDFTEISNLIIEANYDDSTLSQLSSTKKSLQNAETILTVKFTGKRQSAHYSTLSTVKVEEVIKGDKELKDKTINVYENNAIGANHRKIYLRNFTVNNFMQDGQTYLVFLNKSNDYDSEYKELNNITLDEYFMADYYVSLFCLSDTDSEILCLNSENIVDNKTYQNSEFIVFSQKQKDTLYGFKDEIIDMYIK